MSDNLYQRPDQPGGIWYARVKVRGYDIRQSLRTTSKSIARKRLKTVLEGAERVRHTGHDRYPWHDAVNAWGVWAPGNLKPSTLKRYLVSLRQVNRHLKTLYVDEINKAKITEIVTARKAKGATNATIRRDLTAVSSVLEIAEAHGHTEHNAARDYNRRTIKESRDPITMPDPADIDFVVSFCPGNFAGMVRLAQYTGMRQEECADMKRPQWRIADAAIDLTKTKTNIPRVIPLDGPLMERAGGTLRGTVEHLNSDYVFWRKGGERYKRPASLFVDITARAVLAAAEADRPFRPFRFHDLRHWFAVDFLRRGGNIYKLQKTLGHKSLTTTEIYLNYLTPDQAEHAKYGVAQKGAQT